MNDNINHLLPIGEILTEQILLEIRRKVGRVRLVYPNSILTRDYDPKRLNIYLTNEKIIVRTYWR